MDYLDNLVMPRELFHFFRACIAQKRPESSLLITLFTALIDL